MTTILLDLDSPSPTMSQSSSPSSSVEITEEKTTGVFTRLKRKIFDSGLHSKQDNSKDTVSNGFINPTTTAEAAGGGEGSRIKKRPKFVVNLDRSEEKCKVPIIIGESSSSSSSQGLEDSPLIFERPQIMRLSGDRKLQLSKSDSSILGSNNNNNNLRSPGTDQDSSASESDFHSERDSSSTSSSTATTPLANYQATTPRSSTTTASKKKHKSRGKPQLHYRPENGIVLNLESYDPEVPILDQDDQIDNADVSFLHYALTSSRRMVVVTGAGISCSSGIPDFRSSNGLFRSLKSSTSSSQSSGSGGSPGRELFTKSVYDDSEKTGEFHAMVNNLHAMSRDSEPSKFHHLLNDIAQTGRLLRHYTQNIDCLESKLPHLQTKVPLPANGPWPATIQLHGSVNSMYCVKCHWEAKYEPRLFTTEEAPVCPMCAETERIRCEKNLRARSIGRLRPRIVLYEEYHPEGEKIGKVSETDIRSKPDCLLIVGTTLKIPGVKVLVRELARVVRSGGGCVIWVNKDQPKLDVVDYIEWLDLIVTGDCQVIGDVVDNYSKQLESEGVKRGSKSKYFQANDDARTGLVQDIRDSRERNNNKLKNEDAELLTKARMAKMNKEIDAVRKPTKKKQQTSPTTTNSGSVPGLELKGCNEDVFKMFTAI